MGKTMGATTVILVGAAVIGGLLAALWMCALAPPIRAGLWKFAKTLKWM